MRHRKLVPSLHASEANPKIDFVQSALFVPQETADWPTIERDGRPLPRRAGVSSFGAGGANAHVVLEEYLPANPPARAAASPVLVVLSARSAPALEAQASALLAHLARHPLDLESVAFTLQVGREAFAERLAIVAASSPGILHVTTNGSLPERVEHFNARFSGRTRLAFLVSGARDERRHRQCGW